jgi:hypothetical protein
MPNTKVRISHPDLVAALVKPGQDIIDGLTPEKANLMHMAIGVAGEAGKLLDAVKRWTIYGKPLDIANIANVVEELGDLEFYLEGVRQQLKLQREAILEGNINKLSVRYKSLTYSDQAAQERADKTEIQVGCPATSGGAHERLMYMSSCKHCGQEL